MLRSLEGCDTNVQGTNDDAQISKMSCAKAGYFKDEFIQYFVRRASRRSPLINRGYYSRHAALRQLLQSFLAAAAASGQQPQVLVLGAGFDSTWFQLSHDKGQAPYKCLELDFKEVTQRKAAIIAKEPALHSLLAVKEPPALLLEETAGPATEEPAVVVAAGEPSSAVLAAASTDADTFAPAAAAAASSPDTATTTPAAVVVDPAAGRVLSSQYCLLPVDLRNVEALGSVVRHAGWDTGLPTYVLSECVLVYIEPQYSNAVVKWAASTFNNAVIAIYEQIRPDDAFGRQMVSNLEMRGCPLKGLHATPTLAAHCARLTDAGWRWSEARDMDTLYRSFLDPLDKVRVERLELFDELEEWHMIQEHYCIALGRNDEAGWLGSVSFGG